MMRPNLHQASRMLTTVGVTADIMFNPTQITNRMRKSIQRQIASGIITGGWSSHAARLAKVLCEQFNLPYVVKNWHGIEVQAKNKETQDSIVELVQADLTAFLIDSNNHQLPHYKNHTLKTIGAIRAGEKAYVRIHNEEFGMQITHLVIKSRTPEEFNLACEVADMLDSPNPISIDQPNWKD